MIQEIVAIIGSRDFPALDKVDHYVSKLPQTCAVVTGGWWTPGDQMRMTRGVDARAAIAARRRGLIVLLVGADGDRSGRLAGLERNPTIIFAGSRVAAFWDGVSGGTRNGINMAEKLGRPCEIIRP